MAWSGVVTLVTSVKFGAGWVIGPALQYRVPGSGIDAHEAFQKVVLWLASCVG